MGNKAIEVLNTLLEVNNDRIEGYQKAAEETTESDLKSLFNGFALESSKCKTELVSEIHKLGGAPTEGTSTSGKLYRVWMDIKVALSGNDRQAILNSCEFGEDAAVNTYKDVLRDENQNLSIAQQTMINEQFSVIKAGHDKVKQMRDALFAANS